MKLINIIVLAYLGLLCSCSMDMKTVDLDRREVNGSEQLVFSAEIENASFKLPVVLLPLYDFERGLTVGSLALNADNSVEISLNTESIIDLDLATDWNLPNGTRIPYRVNEDFQIFHFAVAGTSSRVYLAFDDEIALVGMALPIEGIAPTNNPSGTNIMIPFEKNNLSGVFGFFIGKEAGESGLALFIDFSKRRNESTVLFEGSPESGILGLKKKTVSSEQSAILDQEQMRMTKRKARMMMRIEQELMEQRGIQLY